MNLLDKLAIALLTRPLYRLPGWLFDPICGWAIRRAVR
jgi:hypothetical protein